MQNKYLISRQNKHFHVKTLATDARSDGADITYQDFAMDDIRENIITCWLFLLNTSEANKQTFIKHLQLDKNDLTAAQHRMPISSWFDNQPWKTREALWLLARNFPQPT